MRRLLTATAVTAVLTALSAGPAAACAALIGPDGAVRVERTTTLAAYHHGVEHYVTSFEFVGGGAEFGSIVPLPGVPTDVERGGDWTLQRLLREVEPPVRQRAEVAALAAAGRDAARVLQEVEVDALDITILEGGGAAVGRWAREQGFRLSPDFPEILDFYAQRSPIFMAARYDVSEARRRGQQIGDGTPVHLTIPTRNPWVPLRILAAGATAEERIQADVFLLTDRKPSLLPVGRRGLDLSTSQPASPELLADLRSDRGMEWVQERMWLSHLRLDVPADELRYDLAVDAWGTSRPSTVDAGLAPALARIGQAADVSSRGVATALPAIVVVLAAGVLAAGTWLLGRAAATRA